MHCSMYLALVIHWVSVCLDAKLGMKGAHKFCNSANLPCKDICVPNQDGTVCITSAVEDEYESWTNKWGTATSTSRGAANYKQSIEALVARARNEKLDREKWESIINVDKLRKACKEVNDNSSSDQISTDLLSMLPDFVLQQLVDVFLHIVEQVQLPTLSYEVLLFLLHKKLGAFAPLACFQPLKGFCSNVCPANFAAGMPVIVMLAIQPNKGLKQSSSFFLREVDIEVARTNGLHFLQLLFDFKQYYDSIDPAVLVEDLVTSQFPIRAGALAMHGHDLPRRICLGGHHSLQAKDYNRSIVAGCTSSTSLAKAQVNDILENTSQVSPVPQQQGFFEKWNQHVDDVSLLIVGSVKYIHEVVSSKVPTFVKAAFAKRLTISSKTAVSSSSDDNLRATKLVLAAANVDIEQQANHVLQDLGGQRAVGRRTQVIKGRFAKAKKRGKVVKVFLKCSP